MSAAARYFPRAPRYVFRPGEQTLMRFADHEVKGSSTKARVRDLSQTGMSLVVATDEAPFEGDMLKVEFGLPGGRQVAWFATVVRVEEKSEWDPELGDRRFTVVGVRFHRLPAVFTQAIRRSISGRPADADSPLLEGNPLEPRAKLQFAVSFCGFLLALIILALPPQVWITPIAKLLAF